MRKITATQIINELTRLDRINDDLLLALQTLEELFTPYAKTTTELYCLKRARLIIANASIE